MTVLRRVGDEFAADHAAGAAAVLDDDLLAQTVTEMLCDDPTDNVIDAARWERHDKAHRAVRVILSRSHGREREQHAGRREHSAQVCHKPLPLISSMRGRSNHFNTLSWVHD